MANHKSALKRARQNEKRNLLNKSRKTRIKTIVKDLENAISAKDLETAKLQLKIAQQMIDKVSAKGTIHKKTASRKISRLNKMVNSLMGVSS